MRGAALALVATFGLITWWFRTSLLTTAGTALASAAVCALAFSGTRWADEIREEWRDMGFRRWSQHVAYVAFFTGCMTVALLLGAYFAYLWLPIRGTATTLLEGGPF